jgi:hypothetical protein
VPSPRRPARARRSARRRRRTGDVGSGARARDDTDFARGRCQSFAGGAGGAGFAGR